MNFFIKKNFFEKIKKESVEEAKKHLKMFTKEFYGNDLIIGKMRQRWKIDKINGNKDLYEFRVNQGDRIIFMYNTDIFYLCWGKHDDAINKGLSVSKDLKTFKEFIFENKREELLISDIYDSQNIYKNLGLNYSNEQLKCFELQKSLPLLVVGGPGVGKSQIIQEMLKKIKGKTRLLIITKNPKKYENYHQFTKSKFENFIGDELSQRILKFEEFETWYTPQSKQNNLNLSIFKIWEEINNYSNNAESNNLNLSNFITGKYNKWLLKNNKIDLNGYINYGFKMSEDKEFNKYDLIICDDIQEIPLKGIELLFKFLINKKNFIGFKSFNSLNFENKTIENMKTQLVYKNSMNKINLDSNYRSLNNIVSILNNLSEKTLNSISTNTTTNNNPSINGFFFYHNLNNFLKKVSDSHKLICFNNLSKSNLEEFKDKIFTLEEMFDSEDETIICIDVIKTLFDLTGANQIKGDMKRIIYFLVSKAKKNVIFLENEKCKEKYKNLFNFKDYKLNYIESVLCEETTFSEKKLIAEKCMREKAYKKASAIYNSLGLEKEEDLANAHYLFLQEKYIDALKIYRKHSIDDKVITCKELIDIQNYTKKFKSERNIEELMEFLKKDNNLARYKLAMLHYNLGYKSEAFIIFEELLKLEFSNCGEIEAKMGIMLAKNDGVSQDFPRAIKFLKIAIEKGFKKANGPLNAIMEVFNNH